MKTSAHPFSVIASTLLASSAAVVGRWAGVGMPIFCAKPCIALRLPANRGSPKSPIGMKHSCCMAAAREAIMPAPGYRLADAAGASRALVRRAVGLA